MDLNRRVTRVEAMGYLLPEIINEAYFTEQNDPDHDHGNEGTLGDYVADLHRRLGHILGLE